MKPTFEQTQAAQRNIARINGMLREEPLTPVSKLGKELKCKDCGKPYKPTSPTDPKLCPDCDEWASRKFESVVMEATAYTTKSGKTQYKPSLAQLTNIMKGENSSGFCLACGKKAKGFVEPDARQYECAFCHQPKVYGAEELLMMGLHT